MSVHSLFLDRNPRFYRLFRMAVLLLVAFSTGCATTPTRYSLYGGSPKAADQIAILRGGPSVILCKVDGKPGPNTLFRGVAFSPVFTKVYGSPWHNLRFVVELDPGPHTFEFDYHGSEGSTFYRGSTFPKVSLQAERGATYEATASRWGTSWNVTIHRVKGED